MVGNSLRMNKLSSSGKGTVMFWTYRVLVRLERPRGHLVIGKAEVEDVEEDLSQPTQGFPWPRFSSMYILCLNSVSNGSDDNRSCKRYGQRGIR
jgi:hypothetical protein